MQSGTAQSLKLSTRNLGMAASLGRRG
eukprot:COSAG01_NODE_78696_length_141_cov_1005.666667_1_plen_26_part_10